jgi:amino acid transporter
VVDSMPKCFLRTSQLGLPYWGIVVSFCFGLLAFLSVSSGSALAFTWLSNLSGESQFLTARTGLTSTALSSLIAWITVCACYTRFKRALLVQGVDRSKLLLRGWCQPYMAWACIVSFTIILVFNGFTAFLHQFSVSDFFASYITLPVFGLCWIGFRLVKKDVIGMARLEDIDLSNGPEQALRETRYDLTAAHGLVQPVVKG